MRASDDSPRRHPDREPERIAFIQQRIAELKARIAEGGLREAAIRSLVYIGMAGPGVDERAFNQLRQMRAKHGGLTLEEFKQVLREQFFALMLDRDGALAAIPKMLPADADARTKTLAAVRAVVSAVGEATGERAEWLAQIEKLFGTVKSVAASSGKVASNSRSSPMLQELTNRTFHRVRVPLRQSTRRCPCHRQENL
jgi:hypothetical protein